MSKILKDKLLLPHRFIFSKIERLFYFQNLKSEVY
jgi:hypothetical protein